MSMSPEQETAAQVRTAWDTFSGWTTGELDVMLDLAGIVPSGTRGEKLYQCLIHWFDGSIPNIEEATRLSKLKE